MSYGIVVPFIHPMKMRTCDMLKLPLNTRNYFFMGIEIAILQCSLTNLLTMPKCLLTFIQSFSTNVLITYCELNTVLGIEENKTELKEFRVR